MDNTSIVRVTEGNVEALLQRGIVLLDFWAAWCGPCRAFGPVFEAAARRHPDVVFGKVDTQAEPGLAAAFQVRAIPTVALLRDGVLLVAQPGAIPGAGLDELIRQARALDMDDVRRQLQQDGVGARATPAVDARGRG